MSSKLYAFLLFLISHGCFLQARQPYLADVTVDAVTEDVSAPNLVDLNRKLKTTSLEKLIPLYTPTSAVSIEINLRGLDALTSFAANSTTLVVDIPNAGITTSFTGSTRDESLTLFKAFIKESRSVPRLLKAYARYSPIDPIAGNPSSLMAQMGQADYLLGRLTPLAGCTICYSAQPVLHQFQIGAGFTRALTGGYETSLASLPLRYSYSPDGDWAFILDAPLTYMGNGKSSSLYGSIGFGVRVPMMLCWSLTPVLRVGSGGSLDLCTAGNFASAGLTSVYDWTLSDYLVSLTNYAGYITSANFWMTGVNFNYRLKNGIFKNGLAFSSCDGFTLCRRTINFRIAFEDSYFSGRGLYISHFDQIELALFTTSINPYLDYDCLETSFSFQWGEKNYKAYSLNVTYQF